MKKLLCTALFVFLFFSAQNCFAQKTSNTSTTTTKDTTPEPYKDDEFSQALKDLRRFEVITLGAMPFITLDSAIAYNGYKYATGKVSKFNPLATADYSQEERERIIVTSLCISTGIGLTDYIINIIKRHNIKKRQRMEDSNIKIEEIPDAVRIPLPEASQNQDGDFE